MPASKSALDATVAPPRTKHRKSRAQQFIAAAVALSVPAVAAQAKDTDYQMVAVAPIHSSPVLPAKTFEPLSTAASPATTTLSHVRGPHGARHRKRRHRRHKHAAIGEQTYQPRFDVTRPLTTQDEIIRFVVLRFEGRLNVSNGEATNWGITRHAMRGLTFKKIKDLKLDDAVEIYKKEFWRSSVMNIDEVPTQLRPLAFNYAVQFGQPVAAKMLAAADNDPHKLIELGWAEYHKIAAKKKSYRKYLTGGWAIRQQTLKQYVEAFIDTKIHAPQQPDLMAHPVAPMIMASLNNGTQTVSTVTTTSDGTPAAIMANASAPTNSSATGQQTLTFAQIPTAAPSPSDTATPVPVAQQVVVMTEQDHGVTKADAIVVASNQPLTVAQKTQWQIAAASIVAPSLENLPIQTFAWRDEKFDAAEALSTPQQHVGEPVEEPVTPSDTASRVATRASVTLKPEEDVQAPVLPLNIPQTKTFADNDANGDEVRQAQRVSLEPASPRSAFQLADYVTMPPAPKIGRGYEAVSPLPTAQHQAMQAVWGTKLRADNDNTGFHVLHDRGVTSIQPNRVTLKGGGLQETRDAVKFAAMAYNGHIKMNEGDAKSRARVLEAAQSLIRSGEIKSGLVIDGIGIITKDGVQHDAEAIRLASLETAQRPVRDKNGYLTAGSANRQIRTLAA